MIPRSLTALLLALALLDADGALGQEGPFAFQVRGGLTQPVLAFGDDETGWEEESGVGTTLGMGFTFPLYRLIGGFLGFSQHRFSCDQDVCPEGKMWTSTGFDAALRVVLGRNRVRPWIQGGFHTHRVEGRIRSQAGPEKVTSLGGGGYEVGGGVLVQVGERMSLSPGVRYGLGNVPFENRATMGLRFLVVDLGLVVGF